MKKQRIRFVFFSVLCFFCAFFTKTVISAEKPKTTSYCQVSKQSSFNLNQLAYSKEWLALVHYQSKPFRKYISSIDSDNFFLAKNGKTSPTDELKATIQLFQGNDAKQKCFFPARYSYLKSQGIQLPPFPECIDYTEFKKDLNPAGITLIYTDAYMNNPSSLFGHTLMRIDIPEGKTQLVAHGMNYGAYVDPNTAGALYALYGLTGGYYGGFTIKPYYNVINTYNNLENRDIWEYKLDLSSSEQDFFVAHLWEVGQTQTRYYFFTKNCSYLLMEVLDAVRPNLNLAQKFPVQTIPLDTLKAVYNQPNLVKDINYRPSRQRRIAYRYQQMSRNEKNALIAYIENEDFSLYEQLSDESKAKVLDTGYEYIQYAWVKQQIDIKTYRRQSLNILKKRTTLQTTGTEVKIDGKSVINSHHSMRFQTALGTQRGKPFIDLGLRSAYHSLTERPQGFLDGAEINFLDSVVRYRPQQNTIRLQKLGLVKITSLSPYNHLFKPLAYQVDMYINREWNPKTDKEKLMFTFKGGSGLTVQPFDKTYLYSLVNTTYRYGGGHLPHKHGLALGISGGLLYTGERWQAQVEAEKNFSDNEMLQDLTLKNTVNFATSQNTAIGVKYQFKHQSYHSDNEVQLYFNRYF